MCEIYFLSLGEYLGDVVGDGIGNDGKCFVVVSYMVSSGCGDDFRGGESGLCRFGFWWI